MYTVIMSHPNKVSFSFKIDGIDSWYIEGLRRYERMGLIGRYYISCGMFCNVIG